MPSAVGLPGQVDAALAGGVAAGVAASGAGAAAASGATCAAATAGELCAGTAGAPGAGAAAANGATAAAATAGELCAGTGGAAGAPGAFGTTVRAPTSVVAWTGARETTETERLCDRMAPTTAVHIRMVSAPISAASRMGNLLTLKALDAIGAASPPANHLDAR